MKKSLLVVLMVGLVVGMVGFMSPTLFSKITPEPTLTPSPTPEPTPTPTITPEPTLTPSPTPNRLPKSRDEILAEKLSPSYIQYLLDDIKKRRVFGCEYATYVSTSVSEEYIVHKFTGYNCLGKGAEMEIAAVIPLPPK